MEGQKRARMVNQSSSITNLPLHILMEIISRLPIKTVMVVRCVSKSLLSLVSDYHFQTLYSTRAPTELIVSDKSESSKTLSIAEYFFEDDSVTAVDAKSNVVFELKSFNFGLGATVPTLTLVNSCCGLVCFRGPYHNRIAVICNPFTREYITFACPSRMDKTIEKQCICYGLGFSPKDNKFKLLRLILRTNVDTGSGGEKGRMVGEIYTFGVRGSSWKRVANHPHVHMTGQEKIVFHERVLHWDCTWRNAIVTFDFDTELFGTLVTPTHMCDRSSREGIWSSVLGVFENCLCISCCVGNFVVIWAMKEYGQGSWVKIFSIRKDGNSSGGSYEPFKYLPNGKVLMFKNFGGIVCFDPVIKSVKQVSGLPHRKGAVLIRPNLVSLKVLLGDNVKVVKLWGRKKAATVPRVQTSSVAVKDVVKLGEDSQGCVPTSLSTKVKEDVFPTILVSQQDGADIGSFGSQDLRPPKDGCAGQSSSETQKPVEEVGTLKAEERKSKVIETLNAKIDRQGKAIAKLKQRKRKDRAFMSFMYQQMLNMNPNIPACPVSDYSSSSDDSD